MYQCALWGMTVVHQNNIQSVYLQNLSLDLLEHAVDYVLLKNKSNLILWAILEDLSLI